MTDQTEQEPMDPWDYLSAFIEANALRPPGGQQAGGPRYPLVPSVAKELRAIVAGGRAAVAAQVRERDAQIARLSAQVADTREAAEKYRNLYILICAMFDEPAHYPGTLSPLALVQMCKDERDTLRAERDAAQQAAAVAQQEVIFYRDVAGRHKHSHAELASLVGAALVYATLDSEAGERLATAPDHALTETVWKLVQQRGRMESALLLVRDCIAALAPGHRTGYDWNADPLYLTRKEGEALNAIDAALTSSTRPQEQP